MNDVEFRIFKKSESIQLTVNSVVYSILLSSLCIAFLADQFFNDSLIENVGVTCGISACILVIVFKIAQPFRRQALNGTLDEVLKFKKAEISIGRRTYSLNEIIKIEFSVGDYYNRWEYQSKGNLNPARTNGTSNTLKVILKSEEKITVNFQLAFENEFLRMRELLIKYHFENKIHFLKLIEYLKIDKYEDIQEFKKTYLQNYN